jgi:hypothetical protein
MFRHRNHLTIVQRRIAVALASALAVTAAVGGVAMSSADAPADRAESASIATADTDITDDVAADTTADTVSGTAIPTASTSPDHGGDSGSAGQPDGDAPAGQPDGTSAPDPATLPTTPPAIADAEPVDVDESDESDVPAAAAPGGASTMIEPDDALESTPGPDAGSIVALAGLTTRPVHAPGSVTDLALLEPTSPPATPATPLLAQGAPGGLTSNAFGCLSNCLTHAVLTPSNEGPVAYLDVETKVATVGSLWVLDEPTFTISGVPVVPAKPTVTSGKATTSWTTAVEFEYGKEYHVVLEVEDTQHNSKWAMATWTLPEPGSCYSQCITMAKVEPTDDHTRVNLVITTSAPASEDIDFAVAVSPQSPGMIGDHPVLPADVPFVLDQDGDNDIRGHVDGLAPDTGYHVLVRATDEAGFTSYALGQFTTGSEVPVDVTIGFERIYVHFDGDAGAWGKGELSFVWGRLNEEVSATAFGARSEEKIGDDTSVSLGDANYWVSVGQGGTIALEVDAHENDTHGNVVYDECWKLRRMLLLVQNYDETCMTRTNIALSGPMTLGEIAALPACEYYGISGEKANDRCLKLQSMSANDQHAIFDAIVSFRIED